MERVRNLLRRDAVPQGAAVLAVVLTLPALWVGFQLDDFPMRMLLLQLPESLAGPGDVFSAIAGDPAATHELMELGVLPWWTADELRLAFLRPVSIVTHRLDYALWPGSAGLMHLHSLLWLGVLVGSAAVLYRRIIGRVWIAGLAAILYAVDDAHAYPAAWIANRNALIATSFGVLALICHDRWRRRGWMPGPWLAAASVGLALFSAEIGVATLAYLLAYAVVLECEGARGDAPGEPRGAYVLRAGGWSRCLASLAPYIPVAAVWTLVYRLGGYGTDASGFYIDPLRQPTGFLHALIERAPVLLLGQWAMPYADAYNVLSGTDALALWLRSVGMVALLAIALTPLIRRSPRARFWALGMLLSLIPIAATAPANRLLFFVGIGAMGLLAEFLGGLVDQAEWLPGARPWRWLAGTLAGLFLIVHVVFAPLLSPVTAFAPRVFGEPIRAAMLSIPDDPALAGQTLVIVNAPDHLIFVTIAWPTRLLEGMVMARQVRALSTQPVTVDITRVDELTLRFRFEGGLYHSMLGLLFRGPDRPMRAGQVVELDGMRVQVTRVTPAGEPLEALFLFDRPLEDPSLRWVQWDDGGFVPFSPPPQGQTVTLPAPRGPLEAQHDEMIENYRKARERTGRE